MLEKSRFIYLVFFVVLMVAVLQDISRVNLSIHCKKFTVNFFGSIEFSRKWHRSLLFKRNLHVADFNSEASSGIKKRAFFNLYRTKI